MTTLSGKTRPGLLAGAPDAVALVSADVTMTYAELRVAVDAEAARLGDQRSLVFLPMRNDIASVVALLGALQANHPVVLLDANGSGRQQEIIDLYSGAADLHPDLALLLSTSGSTGSPKLVRLSLSNLVANAESIGAYLELTSDDRAVTSLPLHYCYGLSVLTSYLRAGAGVVLTDLSVADGCFWEIAAEHRVTSLAGVPYTFDLLDQVGFDELSLPSLRYLTQAGGRMDPARVARFAALGERQGWELFVMYGQTEATARMAYLPPHLAAQRPEAIGLPIPGGAFHLRPLDDEELASDDGVGELVYTGPNVMMGYATTPEDLARGAELTELRTGDLARQAEDGLWEIRGRIDRHVKVFGLRIDLDRVQRDIPDLAAAVALGNQLHAFVLDPDAQHQVRDDVTAATGLPASAVAIHTIDEVPTTPRGKVDTAKLEELAASAPTALTITSGSSASAIRDLYAHVLGKPQATTSDSFVALGGDSLSFVEVSVQLSERLGRLPNGWQYLSPDQLSPLAVHGKRQWTWVEPTVILRVLAIFFITASHAGVMNVLGGAHVLFAVAGYNLARFTLPVTGRTRRVRRLLGSMLGIAVPASLWILIVNVVHGHYHWTTALFLHRLFYSPRWSPDWAYWWDWEYWFVEALVWFYIGLAVVLAVPLFDRAQRRQPFGFALAWLVIFLVGRYGYIGIGAPGTETNDVIPAAWCIALGWAAAEARATRQKLLVAALAVLATWGFFEDDLVRQGVATIGMLLLLVPWSVPMPRLAARVCQVIATASLWIYLTQWQVYPELADAGHPWLGVIASFAAGIAASALTRAVWSRRWLVTRRLSPSADAV